MHRNQNNAHRNRFGGSPQSLASDAIGLEEERLTAPSIPLQARFGKQPALRRLRDHRNPHSVDAMYGKGSEILC